ncbi:MAG: AAA family ATPase, partial [Promethearchaeota archaeon]
YKINNQHIYPIHDKDTQNEIIYTKMIHPANLLKCKDADIIRFDDRRPNIDDYEQKVIVMSQAQLTAEIKGAFECGLMVENISCSSNGSINKCSYKNKWLIVFDDYETVINVLSICREFEEIKNFDKRLNAFTYQGQTLQSITRQLMDIFNRRLTSSVYNDDVYNTFKQFMHGGYDKTVGDGVGEEGKRYIGADVRRCYTSCLYNRKHCWGLFRPLDEFTKYTGVFEGAYYIIKDCKLDIINLGDGIYDSEFVEYALSEGLIKEEQITHQIKPFYSLPNDHFVKIIDIIYDKFDDKTAKSLINRFCGTLNPSGNSIDKCFLTNDINMRNEFLNQDEKNQSNTLIEGQLYECYSHTQQKVIQSNMNIWNSLVCGGYVSLHKLYKQMSEFGTVTHFKTDCVSICLGSSDDYDRFRSFINSQQRTCNESSKYKLGMIRPCEGTQGYIPDDGYRKRIDYRLKSRVFDKSTNPESITLPKGNMGIFVHGSAGCGKTHTLVNKILPLLEEDTYIVSSTANKALCNLQKHGVEKKYLKNLMEVFTTKNFNQMIYDGKVKTLIVDEYTMTGVRYMKLIYKLFIEHNFRIIFVGDDKQIPSVDARNIKYHDKQFFKEMIELDIELTTQHRSNQGLTDVAMKVYNDGEFKCDQVGECDMNICYLRRTCDAINAKFSKRYEKGFKGHNDFYYDVGAPVMLFTNHWKDDNMVNGTCFTIEEIDEESGIVVVSNDDNGIYLSLKEFKKNITLAHAITTHKLQGTTIRGKVCIHDTNLMKRELLYTAITRLTTLDNLYVPEPVELKKINHYKFHTNKDKDWTYDFTNKNHSAFLYSVIDSEGNMSDAKASEFIDELKDKKIHIIKIFEYNDLGELKKELERVNSLKKFKDIKEGTYKRVQREIKNSKGYIWTNTNKKGKTFVRFRIKIRGKEYTKQWAVGKKRTLDQAMDLAIAYQIEMSN